MEAIGRAVPGFARAGRGRRSFFSFRKRAKEPEKRNPNGVGFARKPSGGPHPALRAAVGGAFFLFFRERSERTKEKKP